MPHRHQLASAALAVALALLFALPAAAQTSAVPDTLDQRLKACATCHGANGEGLATKNEYYPRLAGKPAGYLYNQLINFRERRRDSAIMTYLVGSLSDVYLFEIASHYAAMQPPFPAPSTRASAAELARGGKLVNDGDASRALAACTACHGTALTGAEPAIPGLLGLYPPYVSAQMGAWKNDKRHAMQPDCMQQVAKKLTPEDIGAVTAWLVAQPPPATLRPMAATPAKLPLDCGGLSPKPAKK